METVTIQGNPLSLVGQLPKVGDLAPDFTVTNQDMKPVTLSDLKSKVLVLLSVPSLDTPVCDLEARRFNNEAKNLGYDVGIVVISMDLPFAQKRWCGANGIENVQVFSDYKDRDFGLKYGVLIKEIGLLARCVFVLDEKRNIRYLELVKEITNEPNYEEVLTNIKKLL